MTVAPNELRTDKREVVQTTDQAIQATSLKPKGKQISFVNRTVENVDGRRLLTVVEK